MRACCRDMRGSSLRIEQSTARPIVTGDVPIWNVRSTPLTSTYSSVGIPPRRYTNSELRDGVDGRGHLVRRRARRAPERHLVGVVVADLGAHVRVVGEVHLHRRGAL